MEPTEDMKKAAVELKRKLFGMATTLDAAGFVGLGDGELMVFLHCSRARWKGERPMDWNGYPVRWRYNVGPAVAGLSA